MNRNWDVTGSVLTLRNVQKGFEDSGDNAVYQCKAENKHGYLWANFYLNIFGNAKFSIKKLMRFVGSSEPRLLFISYVHFHALLHIFSISDSPTFFQLPYLSFFRTRVKSKL